MRGLIMLSLLLPMGASAYSSSSSLRSSSRDDAEAGVRLSFLNAAPPLSDVTDRITRQLDPAKLELDFNTVCQELRMIFHDQCSCGVLSGAAGAGDDDEEQKASDRIDCHANGVHAVATFATFDFLLTELAVCRDSRQYAGTCITIHYANEQALYCEAAANKLPCECTLCQPAWAPSLLGLNITCDASNPAPGLETKGVCELASHVLDLGMVPKALMSPGAIVGTTFGTLLAVFLLIVLALYLFQRDLLVSLVARCSGSCNRCAKSITKCCRKGTDDVPPGTKEEQPPVEESSKIEQKYMAEFTNSQEVPSSDNLPPAPRNNNRAGGSGRVKSLSGGGGLSQKDSLALS